LGPINTGVREEPLNVTVSPAKNPVPLIDNVTPEEPAATGFGASDWMTGGASLVPIESNIVVSVWTVGGVALVVTIVIGHEST
jgi:hypothetical protein